MLKEYLTVKTNPKCSEENILRWENYRVTVLGERLFRLECSPNLQFRDEATQAIWFRNVKKQNFTVNAGAETVIIQTPACKLILRRDKGQVCVELDGKTIYPSAYGNLLGTYRTLDQCDGDMLMVPTEKGIVEKKIQLCMGVCSKTGVAVLDDSASLTLGEDGEVKNQRADGTDEYIFVYGHDYRGAVHALYALTGLPPLVPRFALGNWWSRYHAYTDKEYLRVLAAFEEREIPLSVATVDMDWHYSEKVDEQMQVTAQGKNSSEYVGACAVNLGWTGYTWNKELFQNYQQFLQTLQEKGLKVTLNLHPSDGVRFWEQQYKEMANAMGMYASSGKQIPFDFANSNFINPYFELLHHPYEKQGVDFWWIDWQQPDIPWRVGEECENGYDPLWALNHYHYLDHAHGHKTPLILSRYAGIGSHRYPVGFSGDSTITWKTLAYLPYFTATASNVGYTWWSHDIGGHMIGEKNDELYLRHVQYGVFSPINRLHCSSSETMTKEPWAYGNGKGLIAEQFLKLRHALVPYLYTASYRTATEGKALVEPLYYEWDTPAAYQYTTEYLFGSELLVAPVTTKCYPDGYARVRAWLPKGKWTDIFTGDEYEIGEGGKELTMYRTSDSIPVLAKGGAILPLSKDKGNGCNNPQFLEIWSYKGNGGYTLYEDGREFGITGELFTRFVSEYIETEGACTQSLTFRAEGDGTIIPFNRIVAVRFKDIPLAEVKLYIDGVEAQVEEWLTDCAAIRFRFQRAKTYRIEARFAKKDRLTTWKARAQKILLVAEGENSAKQQLYETLQQSKSEEEYLTTIDNAKMPQIVKLRLKEIV